MDLIIKGFKENIKFKTSLSGDKSIAHRALIIGCLPKGEYTIHNFPNNKDCLATLKAMETLGVKINVENDVLKVKSPGYKNFIKKFDIIDAENSGTTARLISGLISGDSLCGIVTGDESLKKRPMKRIEDPLKLMGANLKSKEGCLPLEFYPNDHINGITYKMPMASAQVKSCILIAGFLGKGETIINETVPTRDHTERMFEYLGADIKEKDNYISIKNSNLKSKDIYVPGDISSAAFLMALALINNNAELYIENVLLNERRRKFLDILIKMNGNIKYTIEKNLNNELIGSIRVKNSYLKGIRISKEEVPNIIDEIPVISVLASYAEGETIIEGVQELKYKESNRIQAILDNLRKFFVKCKYENNSIKIIGNKNTISKTVQIETHNDHRIALAFLCMAKKNKEKTIIKNWDCTNISFFNSLKYIENFIWIDKNI